MNRPRPTSTEIWETLGRFLDANAELTGALIESPQVVASSPRVTIAFMDMLAAQMEIMELMDREQGHQDNGS